MSWSRRELLRGALGGSALLFAGCAGDGIEYSVPETGTATQAGDASAAVGGAETVTPREEPETKPPAEREARAQESSVDNSQLEATTDEILSELDWFAGEYSVAIQRCLSRANSVRQTLEGFEETPQLSQHNIDRIEKITVEYYNLLRETLGPHFRSARIDDIVGTSQGYFEALRTFADRGDLDAMRQELSNLRAHYGRLSQPRNFRAKFPEFPIRSPLAETMSGGSGTTFVVSDPERDFTTVVRTSSSVGPRSRAVGLVTSSDRQHFYERQAGLFRLVDVSAGRTDRTFLNVHTGSGHVPLYVQQFADRGTAAEAYTSLLNSPVFVEGTETIGEAEWNRGYYFQNISFEYVPLQNRYLVSDEDGTILYEEKRSTDKIGRQLAIREGHILYDSQGNVIYDADGVMPQEYVGGQNPDAEGDIIYSYLTKAGRYVIAADPSVTPWSKQPDGAMSPLTGTWLG